MSDGGSLFLWVTPSGGKLWRWAYTHEGKEELMAFGKYLDARSSGADSLDSGAWKECEDGFDALMDAFRRVKESYYLMDAGAELGELCIERGQLREGLGVVSYALAAADTVEASPTSQTFAGSLEVQKRKILYRLNDLPNSLKALNRAIAIQKQLGHEDRLIETQNLVNEWFPPALTSAGGPGGDEQAVAN